MTFFDSSYFIFQIQIIFYLSYMYWHFYQNENIYILLYTYTTHVQCNYMYILTGKSFSKLVKAIYARGFVFFNNCFFNCCI